MDNFRYTKIAQEPFAVVDFGVIVVQPAVAVGFNFATTYYPTIAVLFS